MKAFLWLVAGLSTLAICAAAVLPLLDVPTINALSEAVGVQLPARTDAPPAEAAAAAPAPALVQTTTAPQFERLDKAGVRYCQADIDARVKSLTTGDPLIVTFGSQTDPQRQTVLVSVETTPNQFLLLTTVGQKSPCQVSMAKYLVLSKACKDFSDDELRDNGIDRRLPQGFFSGEMKDGTVLLKDTGGQCLVMLLGGG